MAKFVIAGKSNCMYYAKAEMVADNLARNLPDFKVHKIMIESNEWEDWLKNICSKNKWKHIKSPIIWRELLDRGGKGILVGDTNDFLEYAKGYYGISTELTSIDLKKISAENEMTNKLIIEEKQKILSKIKPIIVTITNPESPALYYAIPEFLNGNIFGQSNDVFIRLFCEKSSSNLQGIRMEIEDLAGVYLRNIKIYTDEEQAFKDADFVVLLDELQPNDESDENSTIIEHFNPYIKLAKDVDEYAKKTCKILITPHQSRSEIYAIVNLFSKHLKRIDPKKSLIGNSMCDEMLAKAILAHRLQVNPGYIKNVLLVGQSLDNSFFIDISQAKVTDYEGAVWAKTNTHWLSLVKMVADLDWIKKDFLSLLNEREKIIGDRLNRNGVLTFSQSIVKILKLWNSDTSSDDSLYSVIVNGTESGPAREDIYLSLPVKFENGTFKTKNVFHMGESKRDILAEIIKDSKIKISHRYKNDTYTKNTQDTKQISPQVLVE